MAFLEIKGPKSIFVNPMAIVRIEARADDQAGASIILIDGTRYDVAEVETVVLQRIEMVREAAAEASLTLIAPDAQSGQAGLRT